MSSQTQASLLERLRDAADPMAWDEFFARYWRLIHRFARLRGCSEHTAEEIVQEAMVSVFRQRDVFRYDPERGRFRDWLLTIVRNLIAQHRRQPAARLHTVANDAPALAELQAGEAEPDAAWETAFEETLLATLLDTVRREVAPETYQAFELLVLHERSGREVARVTGLSRNAAHLHAAGMIHRDVKPANCLWVGRQLKLADFGLLTAANSQVSRLGTLKYMPPDGRMDTRADVYAAGLVLYEALTGLPAEAFPRLGACAREVLADPELTRLNRLVLRACQPAPEGRFRDAGEMLAALQSPPPHPPRRRLLVSAAVTVRWDQPL